MTVEKTTIVGELEEEISRLRDELTNRKQTLPMHDATPGQWQAVEEIEEMLSAKKKQLRDLKRS